MFTHGQIFVNFRLLTERSLGIKKLIFSQGYLPTHLGIGRRYVPRYLGNHYFIRSGRRSGGRAGC